MSYKPTDFQAGYEAGKRDPPYVPDGLDTTLHRPTAYGGHRGSAYADTTAGLRPCRPSTRRLAALLSGHSRRALARRQGVVSRPSPAPESMSRSR
jgi:hypothetical protein